MSESPSRALPFGMRFMESATRRAPRRDGRFDEALQITVTADGNPWHALASGDTSTETSNGDGAQGGSDSGTDLY